MLNAPEVYKTNGKALLFCFEGDWSMRSERPYKLDLNLIALVSLA